MKASASKKTPINFRITRRTLILLRLLEDKLHTSKTNVVERALQDYANQKLKRTKNTLMRFAGILSEKETDDMLSVIRSDRRNKTIRVKL